MEAFVKKRRCRFARSHVWEKGGEGGLLLADALLSALEEEKGDFHPLYEDSLSLSDKIRRIAVEIYGALDVEFSPRALSQLGEISRGGYGLLPVCMAKTQYSLSDDPKSLGRPANFTLMVRELYVNAGAGFVVAVTGTILTMPGLPKRPAAEAIDVDGAGKIRGLF